MINIPINVPYLILTSHSPSSHQSSSYSRAERRIRPTYERIHHEKGIGEKTLTNLTIDANIYLPAFRKQKQKEKK